MKRGLSPDAQWKIKACLVTFGVLCVLCAMLFPVFAKAKIGDGRGTSISAFKQVAIAHAMYAGDNDDRFPGRDTWMDVLGPYAKDQKIFRCHEIHSPNEYGHCFHAKLSYTSVYACDPKNTELIFDSVNLARNAFGTLESLPKPGRHMGKNAISYVDTHVKMVKP